MSEGADEERFFIRNDEASSGERKGTGCDSDSAGSQTKEKRLSFSESFYQNVLPQYLAIGVSEERIFDGTPNDLKPYMDAYKLKQEILDENMWRSNMYTLNAVYVAISMAFSGKKSKAKYMEKPILQEEKEKKKEEALTEEEAKKQRENILNMLQIMQVNFNNTHKKDKSD